MFSTISVNLAIFNPVRRSGMVVAKESPMSYVTDYPPAAPEDVISVYTAKLAMETDCADVHHALNSGAPDFVLMHAVGTPEAYARRHIPGAIHLPHRSISEAALAEWPADTLFVVYCAGPHCNGADQAALKLARLGRRVKVMIGGLTGWADEGFEFNG
jgi:rhodanese-related sulfurtransferase